MNKETAVAQANLNRIDQYTPQGNITYQQTGVNADGTPRYQQTQVLSPDEQAKYDQANKVALSLNDLAINNVGRVQDTQAQDFSYDGMTPMTTSLAGTPGQIQQSLDFSNATKLPGVDDFGAERDKVSNALYGQATSRLDPRFQQGESDIRSRLAAQGISENSDAYRREMDNFGRTKNDAYNQAQFDAIQAGGDEQSRIFGLAMGARGQDVSETAQAAAFGNQARGQAFNEAGAEATLNNSGRQQEIAEATYLRNLPLNEIASLLGTGAPVQNPDFQPVSQVGVAAPDYMGAVNNNYNAKVAMYNQQQAARSAGLGGIFGALGSIGGAVFS